MRGAIVLLALLAAAPAGPATAQATGGGISVEEYHSVFPPAPVDVRAEIRDGVATIMWSPPPVTATSAKRAYDPQVVGYRVYRLGTGGAAVVIGETAETVFRDRSAPRAATLRYAVTAVQRSGHESGLSAAAEVRVP